MPDSDRNSPPSPGDEAASDEAQPDRDRAGAMPRDAQTASSPFAYGALPEIGPGHAARLEEISRNLMKAAQQGQALLGEITRTALGPDGPVRPNPNVFASSPEIGRGFEQALSDTEAVLQAQGELYRGYLDLWAGTLARLSGKQAAPAIEPEPGDRRWQSKAWREHPLFDAIRQSYLLNQRFLLDMISNAKSVDEATRRKVEFITRQMGDAMAPGNFALTNPDVLAETWKTRGENLTRGLVNLARDLERGGGRLALSQSDPEGFQIGTDLATTPGEVIFRNEIMELIQYAPKTDSVRKRPLLIAPPWINKFYILDLREQNSMVNWLVEQGFTVFLISWVNPGPELKEASFEDYIRKGLFTALDKVEEATGEREIDAVGYCIGGTMLGTALALMAEEGDKRIASATFFAAQLDFTLAGDLLVFMDDAWLGELERLMDAQGGVLDGQTMADTFNMLRANDLVWSFVINNYLLGRQPQAFDLLYWNADQTRLPKRLHLAYLETFYKENRLSKGEMEMAGHTLDLSRVKIPVFMQASKDDHIAPAVSVYQSASLFAGPLEFVMAGSGHIAGVVNPPEAHKYQHWINTALPHQFDEWKAGAQEHPGSWWPHWRDWLFERSDEMVKAREPGGGKLDPICPAPGEYVKVRS